MARQSGIGVELQAIELDGMPGQGARCRQRLGEAATLEDAAVPAPPVVRVLRIAQCGLPQCLPVDGGHARTVHERGVAGELEPEIPVLQNGKAFVKPQGALTHPVHAEQHGMNGHIVDALEPLAGPRQIVVAQGHAVRRLDPHTCVGTGGLRIGLQRGDEPSQMIRLDQVVVIQEQRQIALCFLQRGVGGTGAPARRIIDGQAGGLRCGQVHQPPAQPGRQVVQRGMPPATGVDDHEFQVRMALQGNTGQRLVQARPAHAADQHADQGDPGRVVGQAEGRTHPRPLRQRGQRPAPMHRIQVDAEEGFGLAARRA